MSIPHAELLARIASWRKRARTFRRKAEESGNVRDTYRLAGMASSLDYAARELCHAARIDPRDDPPLANAEAERARQETESQLARNAEESES